MTSPRRHLMGCTSLAVLLAFGVLESAAQESAAPSRGSASVSERKAEIIRKYDSDGDGWLNEAERNAARQDWWASQLKGGGRRRNMFPMPPEIIKEYDKDGDGALSESEETAAREGIRQKWEDAQKRYDKNQDGRLDESEMETLQTDGRAGKIQGLPQFFFMRRGPERSRSTGDRPPTPLELSVRFDKNQDGRLDADELAAARAERDRLRLQRSNQPVAPTSKP